MQITRQSEYAIKVLLELAAFPFGKSLRTMDISQRLDIPADFLKKTIQLLAKGGFITTQRGSQGGIRLSLPSHEIYLAAIIEAIEGKIAINPCLAEGNHCPNETFCQIRPILFRAQEAMKKELNQETLKDILEKGKKDKSTSFL